MEHMEKALAHFQALLDEQFLNPSLSLPSSWQTGPPYVFRHTAPSN